MLLRCHPLFKNGVNLWNDNLLFSITPQLRHRIDETPTSCAPIFPSLFSLCSHMKKYPFQLDVAFWSTIHRMYNGIDEGTIVSTWKSMPESEEDVNESWWYCFITRGSFILLARCIVKLWVSHVITKTWCIRLLELFLLFTVDSIISRGMRRSNSSPLWF